MNTPELIKKTNDSKNGFKHFHKILQVVLDETACEWGMKSVELNPPQSKDVQTTGSVFLSTGFPELDKIIGSCNRGLISVAATPGTGKTTFIHTLAVNTAKTTDKAVCISTLELSAEQTAKRILFTEAFGEFPINVSPDARKFDKLVKTAQALACLNIYIDDEFGLTVTDIRTRLKEVDNIGMVFLDYIQLIRIEADSHLDCNEEYWFILEELKKTANDLNCPLVYVAQVSYRTQSVGKRPKLLDLRHGAFRQTPDMILLLYREAQANLYWKNDDFYSNPAETEVIVAKNYFGLLGSVRIPLKGVR